MRLDWIEDIVAVLDAGSITAAAARRNVSQPAFSRRLRAAEEALGASLLDRGVRPATVRPGVAELAHRLRACAQEIRQLRVELRLAGANVGESLVIVAQHSLATTMAAPLIERLDRLDQPGGVRLRSANRDGCAAMLASGEADVAVLYRLDGDSVVARPAEVEAVDLAREAFTPVAGPLEWERLQAGEVRLIAYPGEVFFGQVFAARIAPALPEALRVRPRAETALTPAALQMALGGVGVAWLPERMTREAVASKRLLDLSGHLPVASLRVCALRRRDRGGEAARAAWGLITSGLVAA